MKRQASVILISTFIAMGASQLAVKAQQHVKRSDPNTYYRAPHSMAGKMIVLPIGTTFEGRLSKTVSSMKSHAGESFSITLASPVLSNGIDVIIPAGSQVIGEVVEAISSHSQPHKKRMPPPKGKLRISISQLRTPDGTSFPLVANVVGEQEERRGGRGGIQTPLGSNVGFVGTSESFEAVAPGSSRYGKQYGGSQSGRSPEKEYVHKKQFLADEIYGTGADERGDQRRIRSLVLRKFDLYIDAGSPLTVKLAAPLRLAVSPPGTGTAVGSGSVEEPGGSGADDALPPPSVKAGGSDIPPITESGQDSAPPPRRRSRASAAENDAQPAAQTPAQSTPAQTAPAQQTPPSTSTPSSDF